MKSFKFIFALTLATALFFTSCDDDDSQINQTPISSTGESVVKTESCPKIGIDFVTFEKEGNLDIKVNGSSDVAGAVYSWKVTGPEAKTVFSKTSSGKELNWAPEIGVTTFELLVTTKECPSGTKITKTFLRTTEDIAKAATALATPGTTACPKVGVTIVTGKEDPFLGNDIRLVASINSGTNPFYSWEILIDEIWVSYTGKSPSNTTTHGVGLGNNATTFRLTVTTDECPSGTQIVKTVVTTR